MLEHPITKAMKFKTMIAVGATVAVVGAFFALKEYNRGVADVSRMSPAAKVRSTALLEEFATDETAATARYVGTSEQAIEVSGTIRAMEEAGGDKVNVILETDDDLAGVVCEFAASDVPENWRAGASVTVKGICTGMLMDVVLVRCVPVQ